MIKFHGFPKNLGQFKMCIPDNQDAGKSQKKLPEYHGWTHSDNADSWFFESKTPSAHDDYMNFYLNCLAQKYPAPKLWNSVFPAKA